MENENKQVHVAFTSTASSWTEDYAMKAVLSGIIPSFGSVVQFGLTDFSAFREHEEDLRRQRYSAAAGLINSWLEESSDYDERVGAELENNAKSSLKLRTPKE